MPETRMRPLRVPLLAASLVFTGACAMGDPRSSLPDPGPVWEVSTTSEQARQEFEQGLALLDLGNLPNNRLSTEIPNEHFKRAITADPDFALAYLYAGHTAPSEDERRANIARAVELADGTTAVERLLIRTAMLAVEEDLEGAIQAARELTAAAPENPRSWLVLAELHHLIREDELRSAALTAAELAPAFARPHLVLANSYVLAAPRDPIRAEEHARRAVELQPSDASYDLLGDTQRAQGRFDEAAESYTRAADLALTPQDRSQGRQQRAHARLFAGQYAEARADYNAVAEGIMGDMHANASFYGALSYIYEDQPMAGIAALEEAYGRLDRIGHPDPFDWMTLYLDAIFLAAQHHGELDVAAGALERLRGITADRARRMGSEAYGRAREAELLGMDALLAARRGDFAAARAAAGRQAALVDASRDPRGLIYSNSVRGMIALLQGRHEEAVGHFERGDRSSPFDLYHHGLALEALGRQQEAAALFRQVASIYFSNVRLAVIYRDAKARSGS
jgi:tetratricopeptide (TPR) repeat protein